MTPARAALLHGAVDRQSGESILIEPMTSSSGDVNARKVFDTSRPMTTIIGQWVAPQIEFARRPHQRVEGRNRDVAATRPTVKFDQTLLPYGLVLGDRLTRVATGEKATASVVGSDGYGRTLVTLTAKGT